MGESIEVLGYTLALDNFLPWYGFMVVKDRGITLAFTGFWIILLGSAMIYLLVPREIGVNVEKRDGKLVCTVTGRTGKYRHLFAEEFLRVAAALENRLTGGEGTSD